MSSAQPVQPPVTVVAFESAAPDAITEARNTPRDDVRGIPEGRWLIPADHQTPETEFYVAKSAAGDLTSPASVVKSTWVDHGSAANCPEEEPAAADTEV